MPYNGSGTFSLYTPGNPVVTNTTISSTWWNNTGGDIATGLSTCITKDGQTTVTANIPLGGFKITNLGAGTARTDAASLATVQDGTGIYVATVGGTADVITLTPSPAITAYAAGQTFRFIASGANTTNVTVAVSGLAAKAITKNGTTALVAGDIPSASMVAITYDGTRFIIGTTGAATSIQNVITTRGDLVRGGVAGVAERVALGASGTVLTSNGTDAVWSSASSALPQKYISGITYANNAGDATNDIDFAAGVCRDSTDAVNITCAALTKQLDANWAPGTNQGMRNSGAAIANVGYYLWAVSKAAGADPDYYAHASATASTVLTALQAESGGASYVYVRLIGWITRVGGTIVAMNVYEIEGGGIHFAWTAPTLDINLAATLTTTRRTDALKVPLLFATLANFRTHITDASSFGARVQCPDEADTAPSVSATGLANHVGTGGVRQMKDFWCRTSAAGLIAAIADVATIDQYQVVTMGFKWGRKN